MTLRPDHAAVVRWFPLLANAFFALSMWGALVWQSHQFTHEHRLTCKASISRATEDERIQQIDSQTALELARLAAPQSPAVQAILKRQADAHALRAKQSGELSTELGC